jgi:undecaprenyl-diphosphatase
VAREHRLRRPDRRLSGPTRRAVFRLARDTALALAVSSLVGNAFGFMLSRGAWWHNGTSWERTVLGWFNDHPLPRALDALMLVVPYTGTNLTMTPLVLLTSLWLWRWRHRPLLAAHLVIVALGALLLNATLKSQGGRERPDLFPGRGLFAWSSYPSGHAIFVVSFYFTVALVLHREHGWRWPFAIAALVAVLNVFSRLYLQVHWPTDLIGGLLTGAVWLASSWIAFDRFRRATAVRVEHDLAVRSA